MDRNKIKEALENIFIIDWFNEWHGSNLTYDTLTDLYISLVGNVPVEEESIRKFKAKLPLERGKL